jgi:hypothetical protein
VPAGMAGRREFNLTKRIDARLRSSGVTNKAGDL